MELFDCDGEAIEDGEDREDSDSDNNEANDEVVEISPSTTPTLALAPAPAQSSVQLSSLPTDESLKADCVFLEEVKVVLNKHRKSNLFMSFLRQFRATYSKARSSLKKRLTQILLLFNNC